MKKLDKLVLSSFIGPFVITFFVVIFILLSQFMLRYFDEIVGKDLGAIVIAQLLFYFSIFMTPNGFPLAVLLSALITFGNLGEHFELTAIKGAGINLLRTMLPIFIFSVLLTAVAYYSNNYIVPKAALKAFSLLYDVKHKKPAMEIKEGAFYNGIDGYSIKVNKKFADGKNLKDIIIYDHTKGGGNRNVIVADSGRMYTLLNDRYLMLELFDGHSYSEQKPERRSNQISNAPDPFVRNRFASAKIAFSMSSFDLKRTREELFAGNRMMKNSRQLIQDVDSMQWEREKMIMEVKDNLYQNFRYHLADQRQIHFGERKKYFKTDKDEDDMELPDEEELADFDRDTIRIAEEEDTIRGMDAAPNTPDTASGVLLASESADSAAAGKGIADKISKLKMKQLLSRNTSNIRRQHRSIQDSIPAQNSAVGVTAYRDETQAHRTTGDLDSVAEIQRDYSSAVWAKALEKADSVFQLEKTQMSAVQTALTQVRHAKNQLNVQSKRLENIQMEANKFKLERYKKLSYAFTILTMFLIGAPLGSIIKRGGLGIPVIISIGFFILFYVISMVTEKYVKQNLLDPFVGAWMANIWLLPVGIFFLRQARIDARLLDMDYYLVIIQNISKRLNIGRRVTMKQ